MLVQSTWTHDVSWSVFIVGPLEEYRYTWQLVNYTKHMSFPTDTFYITIDYTEQYFDYDQEEIIVKFNELSHVRDSVNGFDMVDTGFDLYLSGKEKYVDLRYRIALYFFPVLFGLLILVSIFMIAMGFSGWIAFDMIATLQMLHLIPV